MNNSNRLHPGLAHSSGVRYNDSCHDARDLPELRRGRIGICVATQIARYTPPFGKLPGWQSPEQAWAHTQGQLAYYRAMEDAGEMKHLRTWPEVQAHAELWQGATPEEAARLPVGFLLSLKQPQTPATPRDQKQRP